MCSATLLKASPISVTLGILLAQLFGQGLQASGRRVRAPLDRGRSRSDGPAARAAWRSGWHGLQVQSCSRGKYHPRVHRGIGSHPEKEPAYGVEFFWAFLVIVPPWGSQVGSAITIVCASRCRQNSPCFLDSHQPSRIRLRRPSRPLNFAARLPASTAPSGTAADR